MTRLPCVTGTLRLNGRTFLARLLHDPTLLHHPGAPAARPRLGAAPADDRGAAPAGGGSRHGHAARRAAWHWTPLSPSRRSSPWWSRNPPASAAAPSCCITTDSPRRRPSPGTAARRHRPRRGATCSWPTASPWPSWPPSSAAAAVGVPGVRCACWKPRTASTASCPGRSFSSPPSRWPNRASLSQHGCTRPSFEAGAASARRCRAGGDLPQHRRDRPGRGRHPAQPGPGRDPARGGRAGCGCAASRPHRRRDRARGAQPPQCRADDGGRPGRVPADPPRAAVPRLPRPPRLRAAATFGRGGGAGHSRPAGTHAHRSGQPRRCRGGDAAGRCRAAGLRRSQPLAGRPGRPGGAARRAARSLLPHAAGAGAEPGARHRRHPPRQPADGAAPRRAAGTTGGRHCASLGAGCGGPGGVDDHDGRGQFRRAYRRRRLRAEQPS